MATVSRHVPELDGLRGIAIIAVLIHHQLTSLWLSGGFLGVDIFFVLSGFLITGLLLAEFEKTGSISLKNFYMRRILRLGPALVLYLLACLVVTYHRQLISVGHQLKLVVIALLYSTNWRLAFGWDSTLDSTAIIWSLSIEEQFYLAWPVLMFAGLALKLKRRFIIGILCIAILAVVFRRYQLIDQVPLTRLYYGTDTRADALLVGCLVAVLPVSSVGVKATYWLKLLSFFGAIGLLAMILFSQFRDVFLYRGGFTIVALLTATLIFVSVNAPPRWLSLLLKFSVLRWFGRISYGLYLWHWLVVQNTTFYYLGRGETWTRLALAVAIASASFYLIEQPVNRLKVHFGTPREVAPRPLQTPQLPEPMAPVPLPLAISNNR